MFSVDFYEIKDKLKHFKDNIADNREKGFARG
jgi:hypothetical protein